MFLHLSVDSQEGGTPVSGPMSLLVPQFLVPRSFRRDTPIPVTSPVPGPARGGGTAARLGSPRQDRGTLRQDRGIPRTAWR